MERLLSGVTPGMILQAAQRSERFRAHQTGVLLSSVGNFLVPIHFAHGVERLRALGAHVGLFRRVHRLHVSHEVARLPEGLLALGTREGLLPRVNPHVRLQAVVLRE